MTARRAAVRAFSWHTVLIGNSSARMRVRLAIAVSILGSITVATAPASAAQRLGAATRPSAATAVQGTLGSVSCTGSSWCEAVGSYVSSGDTLTLAESWNGSAWTVQPTPNPVGGSNDVLAAVSCSSAENCVAVGSYFGGHGNALLAELWNGSTWAVESVPLPTGGLGGAFASVSCAAVSSCTAVGDYANSSNTNVALAESWNGASFVAETVPAPVGATTNTFTGVSCSPAPSLDCEAVGWDFLDDAGEVAKTLAEGWNGTQWSVQGTPEPADADGGSYPAGVSCAGPHACTSVGSAYDGSDVPVFGWAQRWNGKAWSNQKTPNPKHAIDSFPSAVSCSTSPGTACTTVGTDSNGSTFLNFAEARDGRWKVQKTPEPKGSTASGLDGVSCLSPPSACTAVGYAANNSGVPLTLAETWNGTNWTVQKTPKP